MMIQINEIYNEDCLETMGRMPNNFIDLTVTSPPYDNRRVYNGYRFEFEKIATELYRVTKDGGIVVWIVADETKNFRESLASFKQAIFFQEFCGFNLLDTMIYHKSNYAPIYPGLMRYASTFEYMFVFSKRKPKTFNPIQVEKVNKGYEEKISYFRQPDGSQKVKRISCDRDTKDAENVWTICPSSEKNYENHPAIFPEELAKNHILTWSNPGDLIYDPMLGSGTTARVAILNGRNYIGSEISEEYCATARARIVRTLSEMSQT